jgi:DNA gyrase/topoisomerase IV subunit B
MPIKIKQDHNKEIVLLDTFTAVRLRPEMYISQVRLTEDKLPIIKDNTIIEIEKPWSPGLMHLFIEIFENALDEAKRCKGKMENIYVTLNLDKNEITVEDQGLGFHNAGYKHKKSRKNVVRTAMEELHAGSNFVDSSTNILGTHGVGASIVNILSKEFIVTTINKEDNVYLHYNDFNCNEEIIEPKLKSSKTGTIISFTPSPEVFYDLKFDKDLIETYLSYKYFIIENDPVISNLKIHGTLIENNESTTLDITKTFIPKDSIKVSTKLGTVYLWKSYENSCSLSFINGSQCTGKHQKIVQDWFNEYFNYNLAHHFYETLISLNVPSELMRFSDQIKTKYSVTKEEIEELLNNNFRKKLISCLSESDISEEIFNEIENRLHNENINKIRRAQKNLKKKVTNKYTPPSKKKEIIFLTEGLSAAGSIKQARNPETEGVYALRGKVKNTRRLSDLTSNEEIVEIMNILDIEPGNGKAGIYHKIVIATDSDADGGHITCLLVNFFQKWFPHIMDDDRIYRLVTPLVVCTYSKQRKYFYTLEEFNDFIKNHKVSEVTYLKGLGSLNESDWEYVMKNRVLFLIKNDRGANKYLDIAFSKDDSNKRKKWLQNK